MHKRDYEIGIIYFAVVLFLIFRPTINIEVQNLESYEQSKTTELLTRAAKEGNSFVGIDVSHYQNDVNWEKAKNSGVKYAFVKATEGSEYIDPLYKTNISQLAKTDIPFSTYHFFEPSIDPIKQAKHYLETVTNSNQNISPVLDVEITNGLEAGELRKRIKTWLNYVEDKTGCKPIFYTYSSFWNSYLKDDFIKYPLWLADYSKEISLPNGVSKWSIWQHSEKGKIAGVSSYVDLNLLNGSESELKKLLCNR
jgi:lysozyme